MWCWFYLKMWMNTHIRWKYILYVECLPVENESTPWDETQHTQRVPHIIMCTQKKTVWILKIYSLRILVCEASFIQTTCATFSVELWFNRNYSAILATLHSSENGRVVTIELWMWRFTNQNAVKKKKVIPKKKSFCMEINRV